LVDLILELATQRNKEPKII